MEQDKYLVRVCVKDLQMKSEFIEEVTAYSDSEENAKLLAVYGAMKVYRGQYKFDVTSVTKLKQVIVPEGTFRGKEFLTLDKFSKKDFPYPPESNRRRE